MIVLLLVVAGVGAFGLISSSLSSISRVTATDTASRGGWGVLAWDFRRSRRLDAHERRWQTTLISGRNQPTRWPDLVAHIAALERAADLLPDPDPPPRFDATWIESRLERLERPEPTTAPPTDESTHD